MASNQGWNKEHTQPCKRGGGMHQLKEVDMLSAKMDLLMKKLDERDNEKKEVMHIHDSRITCEECGGTSHLGSNCPEIQEDVNYINNNNTNYRLQQNQGWNQQQRPNYPGNYLGNYQFNNFNNFNQPPLREMITNQNKVIDNMTRKLASNDKILETINNRMDSFTSAVKNQLSFNKMIESQISQLAALVPVMEKGKISRKPEDLETTNLVDIYNARHFYTAPSRAWVDNTLPVKKGDPGRPVIPISIGAYTFEEAVCDLGSSVNIVPKVIYEKIHGEPLLYTTMCLQLVDQTPCYPKGILEDVNI
jgi:uncharacterized coiled-coil protein SlyX